jgi:hypothetical protein
MKETVEFRINYDYANLIFKEGEGKDLGQFSKSVKIVELSKEDPRYNQIPIISEKVKKDYNKAFFFGWKIKRKYNKKELDSAKLLQLKIKTTFEPAGEECGTVYDETVACEICGANRKQLGPLKLKKSSIPKKDISRTIAGEIIVSEKFAIIIEQKKLKGIILEPIIFGQETSTYYQLKSYYELELSENTIAGVDLFDFSEESDGGTYNVAGQEIKYEKEIYKCPKGHLIGLNLLSEAFVLNNQSINEYDFFRSKQKIGVKRGLLQPESLIFCSNVFREIIIEENLTGFEFEVTHIE